MHRHDPVRPAPAASTAVRRAAVLGSPIAHSLSPVLHRAAYAELGLADWTYERYEVDEQRPRPPSSASTDEQWAGLSLTMPLKRAVIPLLDEISDTAASVEAVNTVLFSGRRPRRRQHRHPRHDRRAAGARHRHGWTSAAVLGAGATASSALAALARICDGEVTAYVRSAQRAREMRRLGRAPRRAGASRRLGGGRRSPRARPW